METEESKTDGDNEKPIAIEEKSILKPTKLIKPKTEPDLSVDAPIHQKLSSAKKLQPSATATKTKSPRASKVRFLNVSCTQQPLDYANV